MKWLTPKQVSEQLQITLNKTYDLLRDGRIPHIRVGDLYRIPENYSENLLAALPLKPGLKLAQGGAR